MRKRLIVSLAGAVMMSLVWVRALAQDTARFQEVSSKAVTLAGTLSLDGQTLVTDQDNTWSIANPEVLKSHEGRELTLKCLVGRDHRTIRVLLIKTETNETQAAARSGDSAFRR